MYLAVVLIDVAELLMIYSATIISFLATKVGSVSLFIDVGKEDWTQYVERLEHFFCKPDHGQEQDESAPAVVDWSDCIQALAESHQLEEAGE